MERGYLQVGLSVVHYLHLFRNLVLLAEVNSNVVFRQRDYRCVESLEVRHLCKLRQQYGRDGHLVVVAHLLSQLVCKINGCLRYAIVVQLVGVKPHCNLSLVVRSEILH